MNTALLADIVPLVIVASISPTAVMVGILILSGKDRPQQKTLVFILGNVAVLLGVGLVFLFLIHQINTSAPKQSTIGSVIDIIVGLWLVHFGIRTMYKPKSTGKPKWLTGLQSMNYVKMFVAGMAVMLVNFSTLFTFIPAVRDVSHLGIGIPEQLLALAIIIFFVEFWILLPLVITKVAPSKATGVLDAFMGFIKRHSRTVTVWMCIIFGAYFAVKGVLALI